ncbi:hypothetical protein PGIGA_G00260900 [Pangasianodon gigas]|uniref:Uncharacterized protein n=1 Tax=Pangasianodon gigas TaxID=30993 RepID=A0ACC5WSX4_PANGG|nr:hypothetical protein [Pangasianodon gigas]
MLNMTLLDLVPHFQSFSPGDFALWFQIYLSFFLPGIGPNTLSIIPMNISCDSYREIVKGLDNVYNDLSATQSDTVFNYTQDYLKYQSSQGGAPVEDIQALSTQNISMDFTIFISLDPAVLKV